MNAIRAGLGAVAAFIVKHDVFLRFMILFVYYVGSVVTPPRQGSIVYPEYRTAFWILSGIVIAVIPDALVVAVDHPKSRRSQLILCSVVIFIAASVVYAYFSHPVRWVNAADKYRIR